MNTELLDMQTRLRRMERELEVLKGRVRAPNLYIGAKDTDPAFVSDGHMWYRTDLDEVRLRANGTNLTVLAMSSTVPLQETGRVILSATTDSPTLTVQGTVTTSTNAQGQMLVVGGTIDGTGANPAAFRLNTVLAPASGTVASSYGLRLTPKFEPPSGATQSAVYGSLAQVQTGSAAGTVSTLVCYYAGKVLGTQVPTAIVGMSVDNMGAAGVTNAIGISITKPTGATNNYYFSFDTADATAAGAYFGRLPILYNGALKYLHVFSA